MRLSTTLFILVICVCGCGTPDKRDQYKQEILGTEKEFAECVRREGLTAGFTKYADSNAVMNHNETLVKGRSAIHEYYLQRNPRDVTLEWTAEFVDVAASGDLGYTYGPYTYTVRDSIGGTKSYKGVFHTVWKKQADGSWKFVWD